jgi:ribonuclease R
MKELETLTGTFTSHSKGFGFVTVEGYPEDFYIPAEQTGNAFHMDVVEILPDPGPKRGQRRTAKVLSIKSHGITRLIGTFDQAKNMHFGFVIPDMAKLSQDIFVPGEASMGAVTGHKVVVELTSYGSRNPVSGFRSPEGKIVEILGHVNDPGVDILSIVKGYDIPMEFEKAVLDQAARVAKPVSEADRLGRKDLRSLRMVTIDGEDAKDLDDAVSVSYDGMFYHLGVHIADVSNYVQENSALDKEAKRRGTSVYLVDRVIPMLPHALCNGICSLNAGEDRLALSCLMKINDKGEIVDYEIAETVINVNQRMSYTVVKELLSDETAISREEYQKYAYLLEDFRLMEKLAGLLRARRRERGGIDFDLPECQILLDEKGFPSYVGPYDRNEATRIIEDFMLAANETVAEHFYWLEVPFVYRVHGAPEEDKFRMLSGMISNMGYSLKTTDRSGNKVGSGEIHPKEIQKLLDKIAGTPEEAMISRMVLRSMKQAKYSDVCSGHFGLACKYYCHFTSPIRRYPDLQIHRIIREQLRGRLGEERMEHYRELLPQVAEHSSKMERRADEAERETDKLKKVQFMSIHLGEEFEGIISSVTAWGLYVELLNTVEGMIHVSKLPGDYYYFEEKSGDMVGEATGKRFQLGMPVKVILDEVDETARTIDFSLA